MVELSATDIKAVKDLGNDPCGGTEYNRSMWPS